MENIFVFFHAMEKIAGFFHTVEKLFHGVENSHPTLRPRPPPFNADSGIIAFTQLHKCANTPRLTLAPFSAKNSA